MQKLFLKPAVPGAIVRQPDRDMRPLAQDGEWVQASTFWHLRLLNGDVIEADPPKESGFRFVPRSFRWAVGGKSPCRLSSALRLRAAIAAAEMRLVSSGEREAWAFMARAARSSGDIASYSAFMRAERKAAN